jgi:ribosome biogenesis GTPase
VDGDDDHVYECVTRGRKSGIACGDGVSFSITSPGNGAIEEMLPRRNLLYRSDHYRSKLLAANVDHVFIVVAPVPTPDIGLLNRCLVACEAAGIPSSIVVNKIDLPEGDALMARLAAYPTLGYPLIPISAHSDTSQLTHAITGTVILIGASGVGKSTLINSLVPEVEIATQSVSEALDSGRHTTTHTRLYHLGSGKAIIDSPGMQEFALAHLDAPDLQAAFPEFRDFLGQCRFYNCRHLQEPGCGILEAVDVGQISSERWRVYRDLCREMDSQPRF